jgi:hypothetical protein
MSFVVGVIGTDGHVPDAFCSSSEIAFAATGRNTGNLAFQFASWELFSNERHLYAFDFRPEEVAAKCNAIMLPAANFLYSGFDLGGLADRLEATKLPILVFGLGAQAFTNIDEVRLQPGTVRLLHLLGDRCPTIVVRGKYTAQVLERQGVKNYVVGGCPSNFISPTIDLGRRIGGEARFPLSNLGFAPTFYSYNAEFEGKIYSLLANRIYEVVAQDPLQAVRAARGDYTEEVSDWLRKKAGFLSTMSESEREIVLKKLRVYFDASAWLESYQRLDGVVGSRIHGVNLGWQAGRPGLVVSYDLRTEELAETMCIPFVKSGELEVAKLDHIWSDLFDKAILNYDSQRVKLARLFRLAIEQGGLTPSDKLLNLCQENGREQHGLAARGAQAWGFLEQYNRSRIAGWVAGTSANAPNISVILGGQEIGQITPTKPRPDIEGFAWSFEFPVPPEAIIRDVMRVEVKIAATGKHIRNSPVITSFATDDSKKVLVGREGWLFLQNDTNGVLDQIQGKRRFSESELDKWAKLFLDLDRLYSGLGVSAAYFVAPNKECVFAQYLPSGIELSEERPVRQLIRLVDSLKLRALKLVYPIEALRQTAAFPTYSKGDSHWNDYGVACALTELDKALAIDDTEGGDPKSTGFRMEYRNSDLLSKLGGNCVEPQPVVLRKFRYQVSADNGVINTGRIKRFASTSKGASSKKVVFSHDSFGEWMIPHLAECHQELVSVWRPSIERSFIEAEAPSIVIHERAERFLTISATFN